MYILAFIVVIAVMVAIIKVVGGAVLGLIGRIFKFFGTLLWIVLFGVSALCERLIFHITKFLHIQGLVYLLLGFCTPWSILYYLFAHLPYSFKEMYVKEKEFFKPKKEERYKALGMGASLLVPAIFFIAYFENSPIMENYVPVMFYVTSSCLYSIYKMIAWIRNNRIPYKNYVAWKKWTKEDAPDFVDTEIREKIEVMTRNLTQNTELQMDIISSSGTVASAIAAASGSTLPSTTKSSKERKIFTIYNMVYGRATAFLSYFGRNTETDEPLFFSPEMSPSAEELREYGILISDQGIYISQYERKDIELPFNGLWRVVPIKNTEGSILESLVVDYGLDPIIQIERSNHYDLEKIKILLDSVIETRIPLSLFKGQVTTELEKVLDSAEKNSAIKNAQQKFNMQQNVSDISNAMKMGTALEAFKENTKSADTMARQMSKGKDGQAGHGAAAEYANTAIDQLKVTRFGAQQVGADNKPNGPDRTYLGKSIQCKYWQTGKKSIDEAFDNGNYRYINQDTGEIGLLEIPKEQYTPKELAYFQEKLDNAPNLQGKDIKAKDILLKSKTNYKQAKMIALSGSLESIVIDNIKGITNSIPGASISALVTFGKCIWNGEEVTEASKKSLVTGFYVVKKSAIQNTLTMQLGREYIIGRFTNPLYAVSQKTASSISRSKVAKSALGKKIGMNKMTGTKLISGTVTTAVVFGPDLCKAFQGKISGAQLTKNALVSAAGMVGSMVGAAIVGGSTAGIGAMAGAAGGGAIASAGAKKLLDKFIEDDAVTMFRIVREEFLDLVMLFSFSKEEFDKIVTETIAQENMAKRLQEMYQSDDPREDIRQDIEKSIQDTLSRRQKITNEMYLQGMQELLLEAEAS